MGIGRPVATASATEEELARADAEQGGNNDDRPILDTTGIGCGALWTVDEEDEQDDGDGGTA